MTLLSALIATEERRSMTLHQLRETRASRVDEMRNLVAKAQAETRDFTEDEDAGFTSLKDQVAKLDRLIDRATVLADAERTAPAIVSRRGDGRYEERAREFSVTRAIRASLGEDVDAGLEREISAELRQRSPGRTFAGIPVPDEVFLVERRTMLASDQAAPLIPNVHRADLFIDRLRASIIVGRLGATVLDGLVGAVDVPRQTASAVAQWVGEDGEIAMSDLDFDDVQLRPRTVGAITSYSRRTLINAVPAIEAIVRRDLAAQIATAIDRAAIAGPGTGNQPRGVVATPGISLVPPANPTAGLTWAEVLGWSLSSRPRMLPARARASVGRRTVGSPRISALSLVSPAARSRSWKGRRSWPAIRSPQRVRSAVPRSSPARSSLAIGHRSSSDIGAAPIYS